MKIRNIGEVDNERELRGRGGGEGGGRERGRKRERREREGDTHTHTHSHQSLLNYYAYMYTSCSGINSPSIVTCTQQMLVTRIGSNCTIVQNVRN